MLYSVKEIAPLSVFWYLSAKKRQREMEEIKGKKRKDDYTERINVMREDGDEDCRWRYFDTKGIYKLYGFTVNHKNKFTYVGVLHKDKFGIEMVYYCKVYF